MKLTQARNDPPQRYSVGSVEPGRYETACGKGLGRCQKGELEVVVLKIDAIEFHLLESSSSVFWWDAKARKFQRTWTSD